MPRKPKKKGQREEDLKDFPQEIIPHDVPEQELNEAFGEGNWKSMPDEIFWQLRFEPTKWTAEKHIIKVYVGTDGEHQDEFLRGDHPETMFRGSIATPSLEAAIINAKYVNSNPLDRISRDFQANGLNLSKQTMSNWTVWTAERYLSPVCDIMRKRQLEAHVNQSDETPVDVIHDGRPAGSKSYMWVHITGELSPVPPIIIYEYQKTRHSDHPKAYYKDFDGILMTDGLEQYHKLERGLDGVKNANCMAHARRHFANAIKAIGKSNPEAVEASVAYKALVRIGAIYDLEGALKNLSAEERLKERQSSIKPLVEEFFSWLRKIQADRSVLPKSETAKGINYCLNQEEYLKVFLSDGEVPIDNLASERALRTFTIGCKNWMTINTVRGADASAIIYILDAGIHACHLSDLSQIPKVFDLITINGAKALGIQDQYGIYEGNEANQIIEGGLFMTIREDHTIVAEHTKILAEFLEKTSFDDLPKDVVERAKLTIADTIGVMINGSFEPEMQKLYKLLPEGEEATLLKKGFPKTNISMAGFANTTSACFVELDEGTPPSIHPAIHILPPILALSQKLGKSGKDLITAFILGYEVQDRLQLASKLRDGVYPHGNSGHVGAAVAVSKLLDWNAEQIRQAINCAAALPLGTSYTPTLVDTTIATVFASFSSPVAFIVKDLVECGFIGYESALGDTFGYILGKEFNPLALTENLGIDYGIMRNYFKFHANCAIIHPALEAAANALDFTIQHDEFPPYKPGLLLNPDDIKNIKIVQGTEKPFRVMTFGKSKLAAKFSLPYSLAVFIATGSAGTDSYSEELLGNTQIRSLGDRIKLEVDPALSENAWAARIYIELKDGQVLTGESSNIYGRSENPSNASDLYNKFCVLTKGVFSDSSMNEMWNTLTNLEKQNNIRDIFN